MSRFSRGGGASAEVEEHLVFVFGCAFGASFFGGQELRESGFGVVVLEIVEDFGGSCDDGAWHAGESCDMESVGLVGAAGDDFAQEGDFLALFGDEDVEVADAGLGVGEVGEFVVVGGEEGSCLGGGCVVEVFGDGPGE